MSIYVISILRCVVPDGLSQPLLAQAGQQRSTDERMCLPCSVSELSVDASRVIAIDGWSSSEVRLSGTRNTFEVESKSCRLFPLDCIG